MNPHPPYPGPSGPNQARVYNYLLGGRDNIAVDRESAERALAKVPELRWVAQQNRLFLGRAVRFMVGAGVRQFLDIGSGLPSQGNVHEVASDAAPGARTVYVDNDPIALAHMKAMVADERDTLVVGADLMDPTTVLTEAAEFLDFDQPVGLLYLQVLHVVPNDSGVYDAVARVRNAIPPGSFMGVSHVVRDSTGGMLPALAKTMRLPGVPRTIAEVVEFFGDLEVLEPGLVPFQDWRPEKRVTPTKGAATWNYGGVAYKHP